MREIGKIWDEGYQDEARELYQMAKSGRIRVQTDDDEWTHHWLFGYKMEATEAITRGDTIYISESLLPVTSNVGLQSLLIHEHVHVMQNRGLGEGGLGRLVTFATSGFSFERPAYSAERKYLNHLLGDPDGKGNSTRISLINELLDNIRGK